MTGFITVSIKTITCSYLPNRGGNRRVVIRIRETQWDPKIEWRKGQSQAGNMSGQGLGRNLSVRKMAAWKPIRNGTAVLPAHGCQGEDGSRPHLLSRASPLRTPVELKPYSVALWGNKMMATATNYFALSVCTRGTRGCSYELGSGVRQN